MRNIPKKTQKRALCIMPCRIASQTVIKTFISFMLVSIPLCGVIAIMLFKSPIQLRSDSAGVEFITEDGRITCVTVRGQFPYVKVNCPFEDSYAQDQAGNVVEKISTYTMQAEPAFLGRSVMSMNLYIEASDEIIHTYILKFADKDVKIANGKVVE